MPHPLQHLPTPPLSVGFSRSRSVCVKPRRKGLGCSPPVRSPGIWGNLYRRKEKRKLTTKAALEKGNVKKNRRRFQGCHAPPFFSCCWRLFHSCVFCTGAPMYPPTFCRIANALLKTKQKKTMPTFLMRSYCQL